MHRQRLDSGNAPGRPLQRRVFLAKAQISVRLSHQLHSAILQLEIDNAIKRHKQATPDRQQPHLITRPQASPPSTATRHPLIIPSTSKRRPKNNPKKEKKNQKSLQPLMNRPLPLKLLIQHLPIPSRRNRLMLRLLLLVAHQTVNPRHDVAAERFPDALHTTSASTHTHAHTTMGGGDVHAPGQSCP